MAVVETSLEGGILTITLNNPPRNTLSQGVLRTLFELERELYDEKVQAVIFTGTGRVFCAGADVDEMPHVPNKETLDMFSIKGHAYFEMLANFPKPIIAAINGTCLGGGLELALVCHFRIISDRGLVGLPEIELGLIPGLGGTQRLPRLIGEGPAMELILTGATISPEEALAKGIVHKVVPRKEVMPEAVALAKRLMAKDRTALHRAIRAVRASTQVPLSAGLELERMYFSELWQKTFKSPDKKSADQSTGSKSADAAGGSSSTAPRAAMEE